MKRLLFITHFMPPRPGVGAVRSGQLVMHLPDFGWDVTVLTPILAGHTYPPDFVVQTPAVDVSAAIKKTLGLKDRLTHEVMRTVPGMYGAPKNSRQRAIETVHTICRYITNKYGWYFGSIRMAEALVSAQHFDVVLSTSPPESAHVIANRLAKRVPWVADFRDLWDGNTAVTSNVVRTLDRTLEKVYMRRAQALVTVSEPLTAMLAGRYHKPVHCIPNAFDAAEWTEIPFGREDCCTVLYAGQMYAGRRNPRPLFDAALRLLRSGEIREDQLRFDLYTPVHPWLEQLVHDSGLGDMVRLRGAVSRPSILRLERSADLLWVMLFDGETDAGVLTGKLFEYLGARRPIVVTGGPECCAIDEVLDHTGAGSRPRDEEAMCRVLLDAVQRHESGDTNLPAKPAQEYEVHELARRYSAVLDAAAGFHPRAAEAALASAG